MAPPTEPKDLRTGWTTGSCASAAAKAAAMVLINGVLPKFVDIALPSGERVTFNVERGPNGGAVVIKDAGDDPDCTDGAHMTVHAQVIPGSGELNLIAGDGIGIITKPGLGLEIGAPAINPVPRRMITEAVREVTHLGLELIFSVPGGQEMAKKTTNERLGIIGGISILGTTGIVRPFSTSSYRASVVQQIDVAAAQGENEIVLATGSRSEQYAMRLFPNLDPVCFVEVGDFTGIALKRAQGKGILKISWVGMAGKITKLANEVMMTHFHRSDINNEVLLQVALETNSTQELIDAATETHTARHFYEVCIKTDQLTPLQRLCELAKEACAKHVAGSLEINIYMVDFDGDAVVAHA